MKAIGTFLFGTSNVAQPAYEPKIEQWLNCALHILSQEKLHPVPFGHIRNGVTELKIPENHPINKKIQEILTRYPFLAKLEHRKLTLTSQAHAMPIIEGDVLDGNFTLETIKLIIQKEGHKFKSIVLRYFDDELMVLIAMNCPQVESLILNTAYPENMSLTDKGLESMALLTKLKTLEISSPLAYLGISTAGFEKFLKTPALQSNLQDFKVFTGGLGDNHLNVISGYKSLNSLHIQFDSCTAKGLATLFQSASLKATLQKLCAISFLYNAARIDDPMLAALTNFKVLKKINLGTKWQITEPNLIKFLEANKNATSIKLFGLPLSEAAAGKIGDMSELTNLQITDGSNLSFKNLLNKKSLLKQLELSKATNLYGCELEQVSQLPQLASFYLSGSNMWSGFDKFCNALEMQNHLKEFYLCNTYHMGKDIACIVHLTALTVLRIDNCPDFNDCTMEAISKSPLQENLTTVQLKDVSITKDSLNYLDKMTRLTGLMLANCYAITEEGRRHFFDLPNLQKRLTILWLNRFPFPSSMVEKLKDFSGLKRIGVTNDHDADVMYALYDLQKNAASPFELVYWMGSDDDGSLFKYFDGKQI